MSPFLVFLVLAAPQPGPIPQIEAELRALRDDVTVACGAYAVPLVLTLKVAVSATGAVGFSTAEPPDPFAECFIAGLPNLDRSGYRGPTLDGTVRLAPDTLAAAMRVRFRALDLSPESTRCWVGMPPMHTLSARLLSGPDGTRIVLRTTPRNREAWACLRGVVATRFPAYGPQASRVDETREWSRPDHLTPEAVSRTIAHGACSHANACLAGSPVESDRLWHRQRTADVPRAMPLPWPHGPSRNPPRFPSRRPRGWTIGIRFEVGSGEAPLRFTVSSYVGSAAYRGCIERRLADHIRAVITNKRAFPSLPDDFAGSVTLKCKPHEVAVPATFDWPAPAAGE